MLRRLILATLLPLLVLTAARGHVRAHVCGSARRSETEENR
jgi:hypothetical protein